MLGNPIITSKGLALLAKVTTNTLTLSNMGIGDGEKSISESVDSLANEILKKPIEYVQLQGNVINARTTFTNENLQTGFYIKELGIYAIDPDEGEILYAYTSVDGTDADYFSPGIGTIILREFIELVIGFGNASKVELTINPEAVFITVSEFQRLEEEVEKKANITDIPSIPSSLPNPNKLTIQANGTNKGSYDGSAALTVNITKTDMGIGNVDNTADADKSVKYAASAGSAGSAGSASNSTKVGGYSVSVVTVLPDFPDANTIYFVMG
ncbi:phage tail protein [Anaerosporobacter faecicola]|uniref:phage tail protein n=1 Tax=Anaerosporobacter faecicola TaxID=2718714 RepID=UPI00143AD3E0|nr:phage tail protein [Anaerosporobacter faecicola]